MQECLSINFPKVIFTGTEFKCKIGTNSKILDCSTSTKKPNSVFDWRHFVPSFSNLDIHMNNEAKIIQNIKLKDKNTKGKLVYCHVIGEMFGTLTQDCPKIHGTGGFRLWKGKPIFIALPKLIDNQECFEYNLNIPSNLPPSIEIDSLKISYFFVVGIETSPKKVESFEFPFKISSWLKAFTLDPVIIRTDDPVSRENLDITSLKDMWKTQSNQMNQFSRTEKHSFNITVNDKVLAVLLMPTLDFVIDGPKIFANLKFLDDQHDFVDVDIELIRNENEKIFHMSNFPLENCKQKRFFILIPEHCVPSFALSDNLLIDWSLKFRFTSLKSKFDFMIKIFLH